MGINLAFTGLNYLLFIHLLVQHFRQAENSVTYEIYTIFFNYKQHVRILETTKYLTNCSILAPVREREMFTEITEKMTQNCKMPHDLMPDRITKSEIC
jgi:hypothetical protein